jgi:hypothetical protein
MAPLSSSPNLVQLKKQAKEILKAHAEGQTNVCPRLRRLSRFARAGVDEIMAADLALADVQHALAIEHGFKSWGQLKHALEKGERKPAPELKRENGAVWIEGVPKLGWGLDRDCTFMGSLDAALSVTDRPYGYVDLMALSGMAFRVRWSPTFCPSCAVAELPDERHAIWRSTGWSLPNDTQFGQGEPDREPIRAKIVLSIDAQLPVLAYDDTLDMSVIYGYEDEGRVLWFSDYHKREMPYKLPLAKLGPMQLYLGERDPELSGAAQLRLALELAVHRWNRGTHDGGVEGRVYFYGPAAYDAWIEALERFDTLSEDEAKQLAHTNGFASVCGLADARAAGAAFLREHRALVPDEAAGHMQRAAEACTAASKALYGAYNDEKLFTMPWVRAVADWTAEQRAREIDVLNEVRAHDERTMAEIEQALAALSASEESPTK